MAQSVIYLCLLFICVINSSNGRVPFKDLALNEISNDVAKIIPKIHIELPTFSPTQIETTTTSNVAQTETSPNVTTTTETNSTDKVTATLDESTRCKNVTDNEIDSEITQCKPTEDLGEALILNHFIKDNRIEEARNASRVNPDLFLGVESYSGFFNVNETCNSNVFFWYFPVENMPVNETPWIIWLQGGPGASSMVGLFDEIGPFRVIQEVLIRNKYTWLSNHSLLFIDNPVGTGFSFTDTEDGYVKDMDTYGKHLYSVVQQFLQVFPELRTAPLYLGGESYAGKYLGALAINIHRGRSQDDQYINMKGIMAGNAYIDPPMLAELDRPYYYFGLIDPEQVKLLKPKIDSFRESVAANNSIEAKMKWSGMVAILLQLTHQRHAYNYLNDNLGYGSFIPLLNSAQVKRAIHVGNITYRYINLTVHKHMEADFLSSAKWIYEELLDHYRVLTYCGQLDLMLSCVLTSENYRTWRWNGTKEFLDADRYPFIYNGRLSGYQKSGGGLTEVVIRGAGHMAPMDAPAPTRALVTAFTHNTLLGPPWDGYTQLLQHLKNQTLTETEEIMYYL